MNRKSLLHVLAAISMLAVIVPAAPAAPVFASSQPTRIYLGLGDSLAAGNGATDPAQLGYVPRLYGFFHGLPHGNVNSYTNLGVPGETSASFIAGGQLASALAIIDDPDSSVGIVTFNIGSNDFLDLLKTEPCASDPYGDPCKALVAATLGAFAGNYTYTLNTLTTHLAADSGHADLLIMTYYNPWSGTGSPMEGLLERVLLGSDLTIDCSAYPTDPLRIGVNDILWCVGAAYGATMVDAYSPFVGKATILTHITEGDIHPDNAGHAKIAQAFEQAYLNR